MKKVYAIIALILTYSSFSSSQSIVSVSPSSATPGQTLNVTITGSGTHFQSGSSTYVSFGFDQCSSTALNSLTINSNTSLTANITIPTSSYIYNNLHDVQVETAIDGPVIGDHIFTISGANNFPVTISPDSGSPGQTLNVTITGNGTHFLQGSGSLVDCYLDLAQETCHDLPGVLFNCNPSSNTLMTGSLTIPPGTAGGYYDLSVYSTSDNFGILQNMFHVIGNVGINELENEYKLEISPNPFNQQVVIEYRITHPENVSIELYDLFGRKVYLKKVSNQSVGLHSQKINSSELDLKTGVYLLQFSPGDKSITKRIIFYD